MTIEHALLIGDALLGMNDAKQEIVDLYLTRMRGGSVSDRALQDAAEQWYKALYKLSDFIDEHESSTLPQTEEFDEISPSQLESGERVDLPTN
jgi:hypothetical protein